MNVPVGLTLFLLGGIVAFFANGNSHAGWITVYFMVIIWFLYALYFMGVRHGKKNSDL